MTTTFAKPVLAFLVCSTFACGPGVHLDPTTFGTGGQGPGTGGQGASSLPEPQQIAPLEMAPYDARPGRTFRPCGPLGEGEAFSQAYSPDGTLFALGTTTGAVKLYRTSDLTLLATFAKASTPVASLQFSPDGALLASISADDPALEVWRVSDGGTVSRAAGSSFYDDLRFSRSGGYLGVTTAEAVVNPTYTTVSAVSIRGVADGHLVCRVEDASLLNFSTDEGTFWVVKDGTVLAYDLATCSPAARVPAPIVGGGVPFALSSDGQTAFKYYDTASGQPPSQVGNPLTMAAVRTRDGQVLWSVPVTGLWPSIGMRLSPTEDFVVVWNLDQWKRGDIIVLNARDGTTTAHLELGTRQDFVALSPDGATVVTQDDGNDAVFWRAADGTGVGQLPKSVLAVPVDGVTFSADSTQALVAAGGQVRFWGLLQRTLTRVAAFPFSDSARQGIALSPDGQWLAGWNGSTLDVRSLTSDNRALSWGGLGTTGAVFSGDGQVLYAFSDSNASPALELTTAGIGQDPNTNSVSSGFQTPASHLTMSAQGLIAGLTGGDLSSGHIAIAQFDGPVVRMIDFAAPSLFSVESLALSRDGQYLAAGFQFFVEHKYLVTVWRVPDGAVVSSFATPVTPQELAFSADGALLSTTCDVWNWRDGTVVESFLDSYQSYPVVSPDGHTIATRMAGRSGVTLWCRP